MSKHDARRELHFDCLRDSVEEIHRLSQTGYTKAGEWNLSQACQHLSKTMKMSREGSPFNLPFFLKPVARWMLFGNILAGKPTRLPLTTAPQFKPEDVPENETDGVVDKMSDLSEYERLVGVVMSDEATLIPEHPVFGKVSPDEWRKFHAWHAAHHFSFLLPRKPVSAHTT